MPSEISLKILSDPYADHFLSDQQLPCLPLQLQRAASGSQWSRPWTWSLEKNELKKSGANEEWSLRSQWPWMSWLLKRKRGRGCESSQPRAPQVSLIASHSPVPCIPSLVNRKTAFTLRYEWPDTASCESCTPFPAPHVFSSQATPP